MSDDFRPFDVKRLRDVSVGAACLAFAALWAGSAAEQFALNSATTLVANAGAAQRAGAPEIDYSSTGSIVPKPAPLNPCQVTRNQ